MFVKKMPREIESAAALRKDMMGMKQGETDQPCKGVKNPQPPKDKEKKPV